MSARNRISPCVWAGRTRAMPDGSSLLCCVHANLQGHDNLAWGNRGGMRCGAVPVFESFGELLESQRSTYYSYDCCDCSECFKLG